MKKLLSLLTLLAMSISIVSCGSSKKGNSQALTADGTNDYLNAMAIQSKYDIKDETDLESILKTIEWDLQDSGLYFSEQKGLDPVFFCKTGSECSKRLIRKTERRLAKGKSLPRNVYQCENITYSINYSPEDSYEQTNVHGLLREYYDISNLWLLKNRKSAENCDLYLKVSQIRQQISRNFMKSLPTTPERDVIKEYSKQ